MSSAEIITQSAKLKKLLKITKAIAPKKQSGLIYGKIKQNQYLFLL